MIYFNQATTSYPKPEIVIDHMVKMMTTVSGSPGRSSDQSEVKASAIVKNTREKLAKLFGSTNPKKVLFYQNATVALNQAIKGLPWEKGDHVISTTLEHNSVRRPLHYIKETYDLDVTLINPKKHNDNIEEAFKNAITEKTKAIILTHACNVTGDVLPIEKIGNLAQKNNITVIVDGSQTVGHLNIDMKNFGIHMLAFPAHKSLLGPQGLGVLMVEGEIQLQPLHHGGTGVFSEEINQPKEWPYMYESGTLNSPAIAGLYAALKLYEENKEDNVSRETFLFKKLYKGLEDIDGVKIYRISKESSNLPIVAFNIHNINSQEIAAILDSHYGISVRAGIHCNPLCHETYGTLNQGMVRASINASNEEKEVDQFLKAIREITASYTMT